MCEERYVGIRMREMEVHGVRTRGRSKRRMDGCVKDDVSESSYLWKMCTGGPNGDRLQKHRLLVESRKKVRVWSKKKEEGLICVMLTEIGLKLTEW